MELKKPSYEIGRIVTTKTGHKMFEVSEDVSLKKGERFFINGFIEGLERSVKAGKLTEEKAQQLAEKLYFVESNVVRPAPTKQS